jgi:hypothetical protein
VAWQRLLADTFRAGIASGEVSCTDPEATAWRILCLLDGLALQVVAHAGAIDRHHVIEWSLVYAEGELGLAPGALGAAPEDALAPRSAPVASDYHQAAAP